MGPKFFIFGEAFCGGRGTGIYCIGSDFTNALTLQKETRLPETMLAIIGIEHYHCPFLLSDQVKDIGKEGFRNSVVKH